MAQDISATNLDTNWAADGHTVTFKVEMDWGRTDSWTDETAYVLSARLNVSIYDRGLGLPALGETMPASGTIRLKNDTNRFSPDKGTIAAIADGIYRVPVRIEAGYVDSVNGAERTLDGTLRTQYVVAKKRWPNVVWRGVTSAQLTTLLGELRRLAHLSWQPPETGTFTVRVASSSWRKLSASHYEVTAELEEV